MSDCSISYFVEQQQKYTEFMNMNTATNTNTNTNTNTDNNIIYYENVYVNYFFQVLNNNYESVLYYSFHLNLYLAMLVWNLVFVTLYMLYNDVFKYLEIPNNTFYVVNILSILFGVYLFKFYNMILFNLIIVIELLLIIIIVEKIFKLNYDSFLNIIRLNMIIALAFQITIMYFDMIQPKILNLTLF